MKYILYVFVLLMGCNNTPNNHIKNIKEAVDQKNKTEIQLDSLKLSRSLAILKAKLLTFGDGNKYLYPEIQVLEVLVNKTSYNFRDTMRVAHYNWKPGVPQDTACIVYLTSWPYGSSKLNEKNEWMLIEGDGEYACECE